MDDKEVYATLERLAKSVRQTQAVSLANACVLKEVVCELADSARNRHAYLADLFERISARADRLPVETQANPMIVDDQFREELSKFFAEIAGRACSRAHGRRNG